MSSLRLSVSEVPVSRLLDSDEEHPIGGDEVTKYWWSGYLYNKPVEKAQQLLDHDRAFRKALGEL